MSLMVYNGIQLPFMHTESGSYRSIMSDDGADYLCTEAMYTVTATLHPSIPGLLKPGETMTTAMRRIQHELEQPRKRLQVLFGVEVAGDPKAHVLLDVDPNNPMAAQDVRNGPIPEVLDIVRLTGHNAIAVRFRVKTWFNECGDRTSMNPKDKPAFLSNRWEESVAIGDDHNTVRTRIGKIVIRPDSGIKADDYRWIVTPPVPEHFKRVRAVYVVQSDGLALAYEFVDEERWAMPPRPAVKAEGQYYQVTDKHGANMFGFVDIALIGDTKADKRTLLNTAVAIAVDRLKRANPMAESGRWKFVSGRVQEDLYANKVSVSMGVMLNPPRPTPTAGNWLRGAGQIAGGFLVGGPIGGLVVIGTKIWQRGKKDDKGKDATPLPKAFLDYGFGQKPLYSGDDAPSPDPGLRSTAGLKLIAARLNDPCLGDAIAELENGPDRAKAPDGDSTDGRGPKGTALPTGGTGGVSTMTLSRGSESSVEIYSAPAIGDPFAATGAAPSGGVYTDYRIFVTVFKDTNTSVTPEMRVGGETIFTQLSAPTVKMKVAWTCERAGEPPVPPSEEIDDDNVVFLKSECDNGTFEPSPDGQSGTFGASGTFWYGFKDPKKVKRGVPLFPTAMEYAGLKPKAVIYGGPELIDFGRPAAEMEAERPAQAGTPDPEGLKAAKADQARAADADWKDTFAAWVKETGESL